MSEMTRDPRAKMATGASNLSAGGLVLLGIKLIAPDASPEVAIGISTAATTMAGAVGSMARDAEFSGSTPGWLKILVQLIAKLFG